MPSAQRHRWLVAAALVLLGSATARPLVARACGIFARTIAPEQRPTLSREKVLIVYDAEAKLEHFVREVVFDRASEPLGFVVPTPGRPTVHAVEDTPFTALRQSFPFAPRFGGLGRSVGQGYGKGSGAGFGGGGVKVLEKRRVGSFEAFVLSATDEAALATWLEDNDLKTPPQARAWLRRYVELGFHYVALRFDPPRGKKKDSTPEASSQLQAETIRITFATPLPYYPYLEPRAPERPNEAPRLLEVWYVGAEPMLPVAVLEDAGAPTWVRPLESGERYEDAHEPTTNTLSKPLASLLPAGPLWVQTFQDQKRRRDGFGDIVFVPETARKLSAERREELAVFVSLLDPSLPPPDPEEAP